MAKKSGVMNLYVQDPEDYFRDIAHDNYHHGIFGDDPQNDSQKAAEQKNMLNLYNKQIETLSDGLQQMTDGDVPAEFLKVADADKLERRFKDVEFKKYGKQFKDMWSKLKRARTGKSSSNQQMTEIHGDFDPEGDGYDYQSAKEAGLGPDETGHWPSRDPKTGQILKGRSHDTFQKTIEGEKAAGYKMKKVGNKYFSFPDGEE